MIVVPQNIDLVLFGLFHYTNTSTALQCQRLLTHWIRHKGARWTMDRLSSLRLELLGGTKSQFRTSHGEIVGPFGHIAKLFTTGNRKKKREVLISLSIGGLFYAVPDKAAYDKLAEMIRAPAYEGPDLPFECVPQAPLELVRPPYPTKFYCRDSCTDKVLDPLSYSPGIVVKHYELISRYIKLHPKSSYELKPGPDVVGRATLLSKDRKCKLRAVYNLAQAYQLCLYPIYTALIRFAQFEELSLDQREGHEWASQEGLSSIDLTAASDTIPLTLQLQMLRGLFPHLESEIELFEDVSRAFWETPYGVVQFTRGQPLGIICSFMSFTVLLLLLLRFQFLSQKRMFDRRFSAPFRIVGDDIVTEDGYRIHALLEEHGCTIAPQKSLYDAPYAMFGGKILDALGSMEVYKLSPISFKCPLQAVRSFGIKALKRMGISIPRSVMDIISLPPPYGFSIGKSMLDDVDPILVYELFQPKLRAFTSDTREPVPEGLYALLDAAEVFSDRPDLQAIMASYTVPGTLTDIAWARPTTTCRLLSESLNTINDQSMRMAHLVVMTHLFCNGSLKEVVLPYEHAKPTWEHHAPESNSLYKLWRKLVGGL